MKRVVLGLMLALVAGVVFGQANVPAIVVSSFQTRGQAITADDAESITELFIAELARTGRLRVVDRSSLDRVVAEMRFQTSDWANPQRTANLGQALNASFIVQGQLNQLGQNISVAITALDIRTLEVVSSVTMPFDINRIFNPADFRRYEYRWGHWRNRYYNIFGAMPGMARSISRPITTKLANAERQRQEQERQLEAERQEQEWRQQIVGTWVARGSNFTRTETGININAPRDVEITFRNDGTLFIRMNWAGAFVRDGSVLAYMVVSGSGHYTVNGNELIISWDRNESGTTFVRHYETYTTGTGRNARTNRRFAGWRRGDNHNSREQWNLNATMEFSQAGRNMTWLRLNGNGVSSSNLPLMGWFPGHQHPNGWWVEARASYTSISNVFVRQ